MPEDKDTLFGRLAVERGCLAQEQLAQILVTKGLLTKDQAQELLNAVAVQTGEARLVGGYEVVALLGRGGMGAVYKARKLDTGDPPAGGEFVALKLLPPSMATERLVARFKREAEITSRLDHDHIVGSAYYASPEQGRGEADLDVRSDIYSLGCTLYHCVTGSPPFKGLPAAEVVQKHAADKVRKSQRTVAEPENMDYTRTRSCAV